MKKGFLTRFILVGSLALTSLSLVATALTLGWFTGMNLQTNNENLDGEVGLRGYYYSGNGTFEHPYEIVSPNHFYNLTRLQNLGLYSSPQYFRIGHVFNESHGYQCYNGRVDGEGNPLYDDFLDMGPFCAEMPVLPVGSEGTPFVGTFQGNGIPIKNLIVQGYPEDIGVFGYVSYEGTVDGLVCENLTVRSLGYSQSVSDKSNQLFGADIDYLFDENADDITKLTSLSFWNKNGSSYTEIPLKRHNVDPLVNIDDLNISANLVDTYIYKGYFKPTFPVRNNEIFTYSWKSSSPVIHISHALGDLDGDEQEDEAIVFDLKPLFESDFNSGNDMVSDAKISLIASAEVNGFIYSRVIQSYTIEFSSNAKTFTEGGWKAKIYCDYALQDPEHELQTGEILVDYHHGNNIGFLAGHVNGTMTNCYLYNGTFEFNDPDHYHPIATESDIGLVGETGKNVVNTIDPERVLVTDGDTGSMNFSKIYNSVREDFIIGDSTYSGMTGTNSYVSYQDKLVSGAVEKYGQYLRHSADPEGSWSYLTYTSTDQNVGWNPITLTSSNLKDDFNSIDFIWNQLIEDKTVQENVFGVFKVTTTYVDGADASSTSSYNSNYLQGIGKSRIINGAEKKKIYFSTAEYNHRSAKGGSFNPLKATTIPSVHDLDSFKYPFSRDYNYCFELDLEDMDLSRKMNYMYNTQSKFLENYLSGILIDKFGYPVEWGTRDFGFLFMDSDGNYPDALTAYMPVDKPADNITKIEYDAMIGGEQVTRYYPPNSIIFSIDSEYGANVSIAGCGDDITIYHFDASQQSGGLEPWYTMKSANSTDVDSLRYFSYDVDTGETGSIAVDDDPNEPGSKADKDALYGHIFKLPKGDYVVGARNTRAKIYYLAVQGQKYASIGSKDMAEMEARIESVEFLLSSPTVDAFNKRNGQELDIAYISFKAVYNKVAGEFCVGVPSDAEDRRHFYFWFDNTEVFCIKLFVHSQNEEDHSFYINGVYYTRTPVDLTWSDE